MGNGGIAWVLLLVTAVCRPVCADELHADTVPGQVVPPIDADATSPAETTGELPPPRIEGLPLDPDWPLLDPEWGPGMPSVRTTRAPASKGNLIQLAALFGLGTCVLAAAVLGRSRRWSPAAIRTYLHQTGSPWGRREDLFLEKLVLELRILRATELSTELAVAGRFSELDAIERPLRKMRARFRSVRREYRHIEERIGPVSETLRRECAQTMRRSGILHAPALSQQEALSMQRIAVTVDRRRRELNRTP